MALVCYTTTIVCYIVTVTLPFEPVKHSVTLFNYWKFRIWQRFVLLQKNSNHKRLVA